MTPHACLAQEILEFINSYGLDHQVQREFTLIVATDNHTTAQALKEVLGTRQFRCEFETTDEGFWLVNARMNCVPEPELLERLCQRFIAVTEEFECEIDGFRVQAEELVSVEAGAATSATTDGMGPIIQELMEMGVDGDELLNEIGAISKACPAITRMSRLHQAMELYRDQQYHAAYQMFWRLCDESPREQRALLPLMAFCKFHLEEYQQAVSLFEFSLMLREGRDADDVIDRLELTVHLGACFSRLGRADEEAELYVRVLDENPQHASAHYNLACHRARKGELDLSLMHLREALISDPTLRYRAEDDADLQAVRTTSEFRALIRR